MPVSVLVLLCPVVVAPAAALPAADRWLATDHVAVGVAEDGSLGNADAGLGLVFDPDGPAGAFPSAGDVLLPGRAFETWALETAGRAWAQTAPDGSSDVVLEWDPPQDDGRLTWVHGGMRDEDLAVDTWVVLPWGQPVAWLLVDLAAQQDLGAAWLARSFDPDIDSPLDGSSRTSNAVDDGAVVASGAVDGRAWALASAGGQGGICSWCSLPSDIVAGSSTSEGDEQLGVAVDLGALSAGDGVRVLFAYGFGVDAASALDAARVAAASADLDGDGAEWSEDCDDLDASRSPLADEQPGNGLDDDCDGDVDEADIGDSGWQGRDDWDKEIPAGDTGSGHDLGPATRQTGGCSQAGGLPARVALFIAPFIGPLLVRRRRA